MFLVCERWIGDGDRLTQSSSDHSSTSFSSWLGWAVQPWVTEGRKPSVCKLILLLASYPPTDSNYNWDSKWLQPSVAPGYIIVWRPPAFCGRTHLHWIQPCPQVKVIFRYLQLDAPVSLSSAYLHRCISWLTARLRVNMLHLVFFLFVW